MKSKIKKIFKNRIFLCTITALIFGTIGVSAATYFPSNNVTYDNTESGLNSTDVQGAIDELYNACKTPPGPSIGDYILENVDIVTSGDGLYEDEYEDRYIYKGGNPNNYITFNNEDAGWRIISVETDGTIKIIRTESIVNIDWDKSESNNWARPATLNTYLNSTYLNKQLNETAKDQLVASNFSIGAAINDNNNMSTQIKNENSKTWEGKVALPTVSEYIRTNSNKSRCGTLLLINDNYSSCVSTGWMDNNDYWWTLTPYSDTSDSVFAVYPNGSLYYYGSQVSLYFDIRPALYLSSKVQITGGKGTYNAPYTLSL